MPDQPLQFLIELELAPGSVTFSATDPDEVGLRYLGQLTDVDGRMDLVSLTFEARQGRSLHTADLRRLRLHALVAQVRRRVFTLHRGAAAQGVATAQLAELATKTQEPPPLQRGRGGYPAGHYRRIARAYLALVENGASRGVLQQLAEAEQRPVQTIRSWLARAKRDGYITSTERGRAGALPGPNLDDEEGS